MKLVRVDSVDSSTQVVRSLLELSMWDTDCDNSVQTAPRMFDVLGIHGFL